jgi:hypothetical protein
MKIFWIFLAIFGVITGIWYFRSIFNPYGRSNYPMFLWKPIGHFVSWIIIILGIISIIILAR